MIEKLKAVISIDNSGRPQMIGNENKKFRNIIKAVKRTTGIPAILNTSFNIHGYPLVCSPKDAISTFLKVRGESLFIENFHIKIK
jgi:carbamoyltransferase